MAYAAFDAAQTRLRELLEASAGALRQVPASRFAGDLPDGLHIQEQDRRGELPAAPAEAAIVSHRPHPQRYPVTGSKKLLEITVEVRVVRTLVLDAQTLDAVRDAARAIAQADGDIIQEAFGWPPNLRRTEAGAETGLRSLVHQETRATVSGTVGESQQLETIHRFVGMMLADRTVPDAPVFASSPAIYVADAADPEVGATLIADPGVVTGAHTERGQWLRDGAPIEGATGVTYVLVEADEGASITYRATAIGSGGTVTSDSTAIVPGGGSGPTYLLDYEDGIWGAPQHPLRFEDGAYDKTTIDTGRWSVDVTPAFGSDDIAAISNPGILVRGTLAPPLNLLQIRSDSHSISLWANGVNRLFAATWARYQTVTITIDWPAQTITLAGFTAGNGTFALSTSNNWASANNSLLYLGGYASGATTMHGLVGRPYIPA